MLVHLLDLNDGVPNRGTDALLALAAGEGFSVCSYEVRQRGELPADESGVWVLGGGPGSPLGDSAWFSSLAPRIVARIARRQPTLGICFGFEVMARALGASVRALSCARAGIYPIQPTNLNGSWGVLAGAGVYEKRNFGVFEGLDAGAEVLAAGPEGDVAAVAWGPNVLGVIFHPEADLGPETALAFRTIIPGYLAAIRSRGVQPEATRS